MELRNHDDEPVVEMTDEELTTVFEAIQECDHSSDSSERCDREVIDEALQILNEGIEVIDDAAEPIG